VQQLPATVYLQPGKKREPKQLENNSAPDSNTGARQWAADRHSRWTLVEGYNSAVQVTAGPPTSTNTIYHHHYHAATYEKMSRIAPRKLKLFHGTDTTAEGIFKKRTQWTYKHVCLCLSVRWSL